MNARERVHAILNRQPVNRLPVDLWHTPEIGEELRLYFGVDNDLDLYRAMGLDKLVWVFPEYRSAGGEAAGAQPGAQSAGGRTMWGVPLRGVQAGAAHYDEFGEPPMQAYGSATDVERYEWWPDPDRFDYDGAVAQANETARDFAVLGPWVSFFEIYCQLRGIEQALMDVALAPDLVDAVLDRVEEVQTEMLKRYLSRASDHVTAVFVSDDVGGQNGPLFSPAAWARHLQPRMTRWCDLIHSFDLKVFYHSDGGFEPLIEPLLDCGIDVLNPVQHVCPGMDMAELKRKYGERVVFHGGVDNQSVLPFGTPEDVRRETRCCLDTLGAGCEGFICCSCHNVQPGTPLENILAMVETVLG